MNAPRFRTILLAIVLFLTLPFMAALTDIAIERGVIDPQALAIDGIPVGDAARASVSVLIDRLTGDGAPSGSDREVAQSTATEESTKTPVRSATATRVRPTKTPTRTPVPAAAALPRYCSTMAGSRQRLFEQAYELVRTTGEGRVLFDLVVKYDVCVDVEEIA